MRLAAFAATAETELEVPTSFAPCSSSRSSSRLGGKLANLLDFAKTMPFEAAVVMLPSPLIAVVTTTFPSSPIVVKVPSAPLLPAR
jgi:hypothetical protein